MKTYVARRAYQVQTYVVWFGNKSGSVQGEDSPRKGFIRNTQTENPPAPNSTKLHNDQCPAVSAGDEHNRYLYQIFTPQSDYV